MEEKVRGILLYSIPYLGSARILKVFTEEHGLIPFIAKGKGFAGCITPFCEAEWVFRKGKEEIYRLKDATLIESFSELKKDFATIRAAGSMAKDLLRSQLPSKRGDGLYALLRSCLKKLPLFQEPRTLVASFRVKLLLWEGLLSLTEKKAIFDGAEWDLLSTLALSRKFSELQEVKVDASLFEKIEELCEEAFQ